MPRRLSFSLAHAYRHLRAADPVIGALIDSVGPYRPRPADDGYAQLLHAILFQQLASAAATTIERRWHLLYGSEDTIPTPTEILQTTDEAFRSAGVSRQKANYLRDIALHVQDGRIDFADLDQLTDAEVAARLTAIHGVGEWTAQMFLMFHLGRPDVLPTGDHGIRRGMEAAYGLPKLPTPTEMRRIAEPWTPYRTVASWYLWQHLSQPDEP